jgi:hypothetical protein
VSVKWTAFSGSLPAMLRKRDMEFEPRDLVGVLCQTLGPQRCTDIDTAAAAGVLQQRLNDCRTHKCEACKEMTGKERNDSMITSVAVINLTQ